MVTSAFLQEQGNGKLLPESALLKEGLTARGIAVTLFTRKKIDRRQLPLTPATLVAGEYPSVLGALKQLKVAEPLPNDYPTSLEGFLHRRVWTSTLGEVTSKLMDGLGGPVFVKPRSRSKRFTGCVLEPGVDFHQIAGVSRAEPVWCSTPVEWVSEYRAYVVGSKIVSVDWYSGDKSRPVDQREVERALSCLDAAGQSYAGYGIDFGVLADGVTALVEMNDGFSLGAYSIGAESYTDLILARWSELMKKPAEHAVDPEA